MIRPRGFSGVSLKARLLLAFLGFTLGGVCVTIFIGERLITRTVFREAQHRTDLDLRSARAQIDARLLALRTATEVVARQFGARAVARGGPDEADRAALERERILRGLDVLGVADPRTRVVMRGAFPGRSGGYRASDPLIESALSGRSLAGFLILRPEEMAVENAELPPRASIALVATPRAAPRPDTVEGDGLFLWAAAPVRGADQAVRGAVYAGILLNRNEALVDALRDAVFGEETLDGREVGTVTIFLRDWRVATNVRDDRGHRAIGTRVSREVFERVFENGQVWHNRAFVVNDWYLSAYEPLRDARDRIIGILYTGILEKKYRAVRNVVLWSFLWPLGAAVLLAMVLAPFLARMVVRPVEELKSAAQRIAAGDLAHRPRAIRSCPELDSLTRSFHEMSEALHERDEEIRRASASLKRVNANYMDVLGYVSHEFKSPLSALMTAVSSLRGGHLGPLTEEQRRVLNVADRTLENLRSMAADYLSLSRLEKGELSLSRRAVDLGELAESLAAAFAERLRLAGMRLEREIERPGLVEADPTLLRIVMENLLSNAVRYGRDLVRVTVGGEDPAVRVSVWNEGKGIPARDLDRLFGKFVRLHEEGGGTGLGLYISRAIVERHGGRIWAESEEGRWARFAFELPRAPQPSGAGKTTGGRHEKVAQS